MDDSMHQLHREGRIQPARAEHDVETSGRASQNAQHIYEDERRQEQRRAPFVTSAQRSPFTRFLELQPAPGSSHEIPATGMSSNCPRSTLTRHACRIFVNFVTFGSFTTIAITWSSSLPDTSHEARNTRSSRLNGGTLSSARTTRVGVARDVCDSESNQIISPRGVCTRASSYSGPPRVAGSTAPERYVTPFGSDSYLLPTYPRLVLTERPFAAAAESD